MTDLEKLAKGLSEAPKELVERIARIINPSAWAVMDGYLEETKRKYAGQNVGWPAEQFQHKESMATAHEIIAALPLDAIAYQQRVEYEERILAAEMAQIAAERALREHLKAMEARP